MAETFEMAEDSTVYYAMAAVSHLYTCYPLSHLFPEERNHLSDWYRRYTTWGLLQRWKIEQYGRYRLPCHKSVRIAVVSRKV